MLLCREITLNNLLYTLSQQGATFDDFDGVQGFFLGLHKFSSLSYK